MVTNCWQCGQSLTSHPDYCGPALQPTGLSAEREAEIERVFRQPSVQTPELLGAMSDELLAEIKRLRTSRKAEQKIRALPADETALARTIEAACKERDERIAEQRRENNQLIEGNDALRQQLAEAQVEIERLRNG